MFHIYIYLAGLVFLIYVHTSVAYHKRRLRSYDTGKGKSTGQNDQGLHENGQLPYENNDMAGCEIKCICHDLEAGAEVQLSFCENIIQRKLQKLL